MFHDSPGRGQWWPEWGPLTSRPQFPFLLQLAVMSPALLGTVSGELVDLNPQPC